MKLRPGRKNPRALYLQIGEAPSNADLPIGFLIDPDVAGLIGDALTSPWHLGEIRLSAQTRIESER